MLFTENNNQLALYARYKLDIEGAVTAAIVFAVALSLSLLIGSVVLLAFSGEPQWFAVLILVAAEALPLYSLLGARRLWSESIVLRLAHGNP